jgi:Na+/melibiose symporter-like transporter
MILFAVSYGLMSNDWVKSLQAFGGLFANILTCVIVWKTGGTRDFNRQNWVLINLSVVALLAWWLTREAAWGNILLLVTIAIALIPTLRNVARDPRVEKPLPWLMFALSYLIQLAVVVLRYTQPQDLGAPIGGTILHLLVGLLALRRPMSKPPR